MVDHSAVVGYLLLQEDEDDEDEEAAEDVEQVGRDGVVGGAFQTLHEPRHDLGDPRQAHQQEQAQDHQVAAQSIDSQHARKKMKENESQRLGGRGQRESQRRRINQLDWWQNQKTVDRLVLVVLVARDEGRVFLGLTQSQGRQNEEDDVAGQDDADWAVKVGQNRHSIYLPENITQKKQFFITGTLHYLT